MGVTITDTRRKEEPQPKQAEAPVPSSIARLKRMPVQDPKAVEAAFKPLPLRVRLATLRSMYNLSQEEASTAIGRKRNSWSNWEAEEGNPRKGQPGSVSRAALAYVFGLPAYLFVDG